MAGPACQRTAIPAANVNRSGGTSADMGPLHALISTDVGSSGSLLYLTCTLFPAKHLKQHCRCCSSCTEGSPEDCSWTCKKSVCHRVVGGESTSVGTTTFGLEPISEVWRHRVSSAFSRDRPYVIIRCGARVVEFSRPVDGTYRACHLADMNKHHDLAAFQVAIEGTRHAEHFISAIHVFLEIVKVARS